MPLPLVPLVIAGGVGLFAGSQVDDAVESYFGGGNSGGGGGGLFSSVGKVALMAGAGYLAYKMVTRK